MLEIIFGSGGGGFLYFPDSGPGTKTLESGNASLGYFGEVTTAELMNSAGLVAQIPDLARYTVANANEPWLKFVYNGKFLFIAKKPLFSSASWNSTYSMGLVYGSDSAGTYPAGVPVQQIRLVTKDEHRFKVRTITGDSVDPTTLPDNAGAYEADYRESTWTDLLYRVCTRVVTGYPTNKWKTNTEAALGIVIAGEVTRETSQGDINYSTIRGASNRADRYKRARKTENTYLWRPVLELVSVVGGDLGGGVLRVLSGARRGLIVVDGERLV